MSSDRNGEAHSEPEHYDCLDDSAAPAPVGGQHEETLHTCYLLENPYDEKSNQERSRKPSHNDRHSSENYNIPNDFANLNELTPISPVQNPYERHHYRQEYLEECRSQEKAYVPDAIETNDNLFVADGIGRQLVVEKSETEKANLRRSRASKLGTEFYTISCLISFSILGCLARLGLQSLTAYPGSPVTTSVLWANVGRCIKMGFLSEDRRLFKAHRSMEEKEREQENSENSDGSENTIVITDQVSAPAVKILRIGV